MPGRIRPADLYRAYLEQSDIFVGLYAANYGWVAPGDEVSGLEDEYRLAPHGMPKLVYVKEGVGAGAPPPGAARPHQGRRPCVVCLLHRCRPARRARAQRPRDPARGAVRARGRVDGVRAPGWRGTIELPAALTALIGRERELETVVDLLADDDVRLVTITGRGGIGKSRLSIEAANRVRDRFPGGIAFVDLAPVTDPQLVPGAIANALGIRDAGDGTLDEKLRMALRDRRMLLLLDNVEQVVEAAPATPFATARMPRS